MKTRDWIPPVLVRAATSVVRSLASDFRRGRDLEEAAPLANRMVEPYRQSAWVHAALNLIMGELARAELKFYGGEQEYAEPAFLAWWQAPAFGPPTVYATDQARLPIADVIRDLAAWAKLEGEFFLLLDDAWLVSAARLSTPSPFLIARPDRMQAILQGGRLAGWRYTDAGGRQLTLVPQQVVHWRAWNPYDDFRGLGALQAAQVAADAAYYTGTYVRELMRNNGDQGFIVAAKHGVAGPEQREQIVADLRAKRAALRRGVARDLFVDTEITVDRPEQQAASTDLAATKMQSQEEVFIAFGVPPSMAQAKSNFSMGKDSDRYQLITGTCQPLGTGIAGALAAVGSRMASAPLTAELDWDDHPVMIEVRNSRVETGLKLWGAGMPLQAANEYLGLGMRPFAGWEVGYLPFSVQPVARDAGPVRDPAPAADPALAEPADASPADPDLTKLRLLLLARQRMCRKVEPTAAPTTRDDFAAFACTCSQPSALSSELPSIEQRTRWESHMAKRRPTLKSFQSAFGRVLMQARSETLRKIEASGSQRSALGAQLATKSAADFLFDLAKFALEFRGTMEKQHVNAVQTAGDQLLAELRLDDPFKAPPGEVLAFVRARQNKLSGVPDEVHARIKASLEAGLTAGESTAQLAARVRGEFNAIDDARSRVIASTETAAAYGAGRAQAMAQAGVQWKAWLTSGNANVRAAHYEAGLTYSYDTPIPVDQPFIVGGEALMHPGDQSGSPANTINCHCVSVAVAGPEATAAD
jgi:hypothetical protein